MKASDIKVGEEYAGGALVSRQRYTEYPDSRYISRMRVEASPEKIRGSRTCNVRVSLPDDGGAERVIPVRSLHATWSEHLENVRKDQEKRAEEQRRSAEQWRRMQWAQRVWEVLDLPKGPWKVQLVLRIRDLLGPERWNELTEGVPSLEEYRE